jgi:protein disulfide-isomerase
LWVLLIGIPGWGDRGKAFACGVRQSLFSPRSWRLRVSGAPIAGFEYGNKPWAILCFGDYELGWCGFVSPIEKAHMEKVDRPDPEPKSGKPRKSNPFWKIFWLSFLVVSLIYAWYSFYVPVNEVAWAEDYATAQKLASDAGKPMLLFFTADWCVPCRIMKRRVFADQDVMRAINGSLVPVMIYADDPGGQDLFKQYNVGGTPITIVTDAAGNVINYAVGGIGKVEFLELIAKK